MKKILLVGVGRMGASLVMGWLKKNVFQPENIFLVENDRSKHDFIKNQLKLNVFTSIPSDMEVDIIVLAVKPQSTKIAFQMINQSKVKYATLVSIVAGCRIDTLKKNLDVECCFVRSMPNLASSIGEGVSILYVRDKLETSNKDIIEKLMSSLGMVDWVEKEEMMDLVTAISGSGPAYFFLFME